LEASPPILNMALIGAAALLLLISAGLSASSYFNLHGAKASAVSAAVRK